MKTYGVRIPIAGIAYVEVEATCEEAAELAALDRVTLSDIESWDGLRQFNQGNVCFCPHPWEIEVELLDDDESEEE